MANPAVLLACVLALLASASAQRPSPITADEAGPGPAGVASQQPVRRASPSPDAAPAAPAAPAATTPASEQQRPGCSLGGFHAVGDSWHTSGRDGCLKYTCQKSGVVSSQPCPRVLAPEGCTVKDGDADAVFPACCPQRECSPSVAVPPVPADVSGAVPLPAVLAPTAAPSSSSSSSTEAPSSTTPSSA